MTAPRILVVEDERIIALQLRQQLTKLGYDVPNAVSTGDDALRRIAQEPPDLILMDIHLKGGLDGIATAAAIPPRYRIPVIFLTAYSGDEMLARAAATNPCGYLLKPFSERELHAMIQVTLARCQAERAGRAGLESRQQARKMEALSQLAGGMADEVNDLLTVLYGQLEVLGGHAAGTPDLAEPIRDAFGEAIEKERLVQRLLEFSGRRKLLPAAVSMNDLVTDASGQLREVVGDTIQVRWRFPDDLWKAWIDAGPLTRALLDLAANARAAMPNGGGLALEGQNVCLDDDNAVSPDDVAPGRYVLLSVADTGSGMNDRVIEKAFEPFFTTKPDSGGSGLGLSLVFAFIRQSGGQISIDSQPGHGTTVRLYLPAIWDDTIEVASPVPTQRDPRAMADPPRDGPAASRDEVVSNPFAAVWRQHEGEHLRRRSPAVKQADGPPTVLWRKAENALFASLVVPASQLCYRLIVEPLPRRNGWDWAVWRSDSAQESSRHGRASSVVIAMAAAEDAARDWDETAPEDD